MVTWGTLPFPWDSMWANDSIIIIGLEIIDADDVEANCAILCYNFYVHHERTSGFMV